MPSRPNFAPFVIGAVGCLLIITAFAAALFLSAAPVQAAAAIGMLGNSAASALAGPSLLAMALVPGAAQFARERLYLTADRARVVPHGSPEAAFLYAAEGDEIPASAVQKFGLVDGGLPPAALTVDPPPNDGPDPALEPVPPPQPDPVPQPDPEPQPQPVPAPAPAPTPDRPPEPAPATEPTKASRSRTAAKAKEVAAAENKEAAANENKGG